MILVEDDNCLINQLWGKKESNYNIISTNELVDGIFYSFFFVIMTAQFGQYVTLPNVIKLVSTAYIYFGEQ